MSDKSHSEGEPEEIAEDTSVVIEETSVVIEEPSGIIEEEMESAEISNIEPAADEQEGAEAINDSELVAEEVGEVEAEEEVEAAAEEGEEEANASNDEEEFTGFDEEEISKKAKKRVISSDSEKEDEADSDDELLITKKKKKLTSDDEGEEEEAKDEEENGEEEEEAIESAQKSPKVEEDEEEEKPEIKDESDDDDEEESINKKKRSEERTSDLDQMLQKRVADRKKSRRRKNNDDEELNDMDAIISGVIAEMKNVALQDRIANEKGVTSLEKMKYLPDALKMLQKADYHASMIEMGILSAIAEWLAPLPDRSLPSIRIREEFITILHQFGEINVDYLKSSGIGKAVMFLYKHPKEQKANKARLEKLINNWARPIFNLDGNFKQLTKEERQQRDMEHIKSLERRHSNEINQNGSEQIDALLGNEKQKSKKSKTSENEEPKKQLRPGDVGFCPRARVPVPSAKDYVVRPKSNVENDADGSSSPKKSQKKETSRIDKHQKRFIELKKGSKSNQAITMSISGK